MRESTAPNHPQLILSKNEDAVGIIIISNGNFFRQVVEEFDPSSQSSGFVDAAVDSQMRSILSMFHDDLDVRACNTDRPPYYHVQSIGYVAAVDEHVEGKNLFGVQDDVPSDIKNEYIMNRDAALWGSARSRLLSVNIHPKYGGWYAYRMMFVINSIAWPRDWLPPTPLHFLSAEDKKIIIMEYNKQPDLAVWREFHDASMGPICRYHAHQYLFFHEISVHKRRRVLELLKAELNM